MLAPKHDSIIDPFYGFKLLDDSCSSEFGSSYALVRGSGYRMASAVRCWRQGGPLMPRGAALHVAFDSATLRHLYDVRINDLDKQIHLLDHSLQHNSSYKK